jgi:hypothetical protein
MRKPRVLAISLLTFLLISSYCQVLPIDSDLYRLLSVATSNKLILVSQIPNKTKYVLDASAAKITVNGKPAEFKDLTQYARVRVTFDLHKSSKDGIDVDGVAKEIKISIEDNKN